MMCATEAPAPFLARSRVKGRARKTAVYWCRRCEWQLTRRTSGLCTDCAPAVTGQPDSAGQAGLHLRRVLIARLLAERGPMRASKIARVLELPDPMDAYRVVSGSSAFVSTPDGYALTDAGRELLRRYEWRASA